MCIYEILSLTLLLTRLWGGWGCSLLQVLKRPYEVMRKLTLCEQAHKGSVKLRQNQLNPWQMWRTYRCCIEGNGRKDIGKKVAYRIKHPRLAFRRMAKPSHKRHHDVKEVGKNTYHIKVRMRYLTTKRVCAKLTKACQLKEFSTHAMAYMQTTDCPWPSQGDQKLAP